MNEVQSLAAELGVTERSVRRYVALGLVRGYHLNWRHTAFRTTERVFLRERWMELAAAREALRTLPEVRLALLYGPAAFDPSAWTTDLCAFVSSSMPSFGGRGVG